jgi:outer membrane protein OmpA-like peptidoglycan-associated protein
MASRRIMISLFLTLTVGTAFILSTVPAVSAEPINLLSLQEGTLPVVSPPSYGGWPSENMLDDSAQSGWASEAGRIKNNVFVFEMVASAVLEGFEFDTASSDAEAAGAKEILVEVSNTSAQSGYTPVLQAVLADKTDGQAFAAAKTVPARWVRLTIAANHGNPDYSELFSFRGWGQKPALAGPANISGTFSSSYANFHVRQQGTALTGCYEYNDGLLDGTIEGRVMKITWHESGGPDNRGPALMVFAPNGKSFHGFWWHLGNEKAAPSGTWDGQKISDQVGGCPHWSGSVGGELKKQLATGGRARLYGILFDYDSAVIRKESEPVLNEVLELLRHEPGWKLMIEGHTDATGSDAHNLTLSKQRAEAVKAFLVAGGVTSDRLKTEGFGESKPVADNGTELGRAQNRRVELVRE